MYQVSGKVIRGDGYGKKLGFPTANLDRRQWSRLKKKSKVGVWAGFAKIIPPRRKRPSPPNIGGELKGWYKAGIVIGPLNERNLPKIEAHLIGFKGNLYGKYLSIYLNRYLRPFKRFTDENKLKLQIREDIKKIKSLNIKM